MSILGKVYQRITNISFAFILMLSSISALGPLFFSSSVSAAPGTVYTQRDFTSLGLVTDRQTPSGGYDLLANELRLRIDNTQSNTSGSGFYQTEGLKGIFPTSQTIKAQLYVDSDWSGKDIRAGLWGVTHSNTTSYTAWPIIEYTTEGGYTGWRIYDTMVTGDWTNLPAISAASNQWYTIEIAYNDTTGTYDYYINNVLVGSETAMDGVDSYDKFDGVIFNNKNYATGDHTDDYEVSWRNFQTGLTLPTTPTNVNISQNSVALGCDAFVNQRTITVSWDPNTDANFDHYVYQADADMAAPYDFTTTTVVPSRTGDIRDIEGTYRYRIAAVNTNGLQGSWSSWCGITYDKTAPSIPSLTSPSNGAVVNGASVTQSWSTSDTDVDYYIYESYSDESASPASLRWHQELSATSKTATNVANASYWWRVKAVDHAGNTGPWSDLWKITIDNDAPVVNLTTPADGDIVSGTVVISGTVTDDNPYRYYLVVKNSGNSVVDGPGTVYAASVSDFSWNTTGVADGIYTIGLEARDAAGNKDFGSVMRVSVVVDNTSPIVTPTGGNLTLEAGNTYTEQGATWTDDVDGSGNITVADATSDTVDTLVPGVYNLTYTYIDTAGNVGTGNRAVTVIDTTAPAVTLSGSDVTLTVGDTYLEQGAGWVDTVDGSGNITNIAGTVDTDTPGVYTVTYTYTDSAGNVGTATRTVTVEAAPDVLGATTTTTNRSATHDNDTSTAEVRGDTTVAENTPAVEGTSDLADNTATTSTDSDNNDSNFFGLAWYWWLLILAGLAAIWWWIVAAMRKRADEQ